MKCEQAKQIPITDFLERAGYKPKKTQRYKPELWYLSPLRKETTPSFKVNTQLNTWYDFGLEEGGDLINLVCLMYSDSISEALKRLEHCNFTPSTITQPVSTISDIKKPLLTLEKVEPLKNPALLYYLRSRGINLDIAKKYLVEVYFRYKEQEQLQYACGFRNDAGDYEFRNKNMKGFLGETKTISSINIKPGEKVAVFEGFMDFLSFLTEYQVHDYKSSAIILNSTALKSEALDILQSTNFEKAYFFMDNDDSGKAAFTLLSRDLSYPVTDKSSKYEGFSDYNESRQSKLKSN